jgi:hypothetical protein
MAQAPTTAEEADSNTPEPYRSISLPAKGETNRPKRAPKLTAPENCPLDQPNSSVMGTTKTERVATAITARAPKLGTEATAKITQP